MHDNLPQIIQLNEYIVLTKKDRQQNTFNVLLKKSNGEVSISSQPYAFYNVSFDEDTTGTSRGYLSTLINLLSSNYDFVLSFPETDFNKLVIDFARSFTDVFKKYLPVSFYKDPIELDVLCESLVDMYSDFGIFFGSILNNITINVEDAGISRSKEILIRSGYFYPRDSASLNTYAKFSGYSQFTKLHSTLDSFNFLLLKERDKFTEQVDSKYLPLVTGSFEHKLIEYILEYLPIDYTFVTKESINIQQALESLRSGIAPLSGNTSTPQSSFLGIRVVDVTPNGRNRSFNSLYKEADTISKVKDESQKVIPLNSSYFLKEDQESTKILLRSGYQDYLCRSIFELFDFDKLVITTDKSYETYRDILTQDPKIILTEYSSTKSFDTLPFKSAACKLRFSQYIMTNLGLYYYRQPVRYNTKQLIAFLRFILQTIRSVLRPFEISTYEYAIEALVQHTDDPKVYENNCLSHDSWINSHLYINSHNDFYRNTVPNLYRINLNNLEYRTLIQNFNWEQHA